MNQNIKEVTTADISPKEADVKKASEEQKGLLEKEIVQIKPQEEKKGGLLEEKPISPAEVMSPSKEIAETKPKIKRKPKRRPKPRPQPHVPEAAKKWKEKWVNVDGKKVLFVPSGFDIMTKNGWRPLMMRADKIQK